MAESSANRWDEHAAGWDDEAGPRTYAAEAYATLTGVLAARDLSLERATVCDFGCGTGLLTERLAEVAASIDAVDTSPAMLAKLSTKIKQRGLRNVHPSNALPATVGTHDLVVCSSVLGFVDDYPRTVARLARLLRPTGLFVQWDWERDEADTDSHGLSRNEIREALSGAGLTAVEVDTAFTISISGETARPLMGVGQQG